uniref:Uncharacterized protein n=1 Tax=Arundo donax TaxID=35708 RepID=A0A0A8Y6G4_ARUDO
MLILQMAQLNKVQRVHNGIREQ